jgi:hypothetical protein
MAEIKKKEYLMVILAFCIGIGLAWVSWQLLVEPSIPFLIVDPDSYVPDDPYGIKYLPVEITGLELSKGLIVKHCKIPEIYKEYVHYGNKK